MKFVPYEKMSKKQQKEFNAQKRKSWGECNPTSKVVKSKKVYTRKSKHKSKFGCDSNHY